MCSSVCGTSAPVIYYIIKYVMMSGITSGSVKSAAQTPVASFVMNKKVMVISGSVAANGSSISVCCTWTIIRMICHVEGFRDKCALQGDVLGIARTESLVDGPSYRAVVHYRIIVAGHTKTVESFCLISHIVIMISTAHTDEACDAVACHTDRSTTEKDTFAGSCLSCDGNVWVRTCQTRLKIDCSGNIEYYTSTSVSPYLKVPGTGASSAE